MRNFHPTAWLGAAGKPHAAIFTALFVLTSISRTMLVTVVPLEAYGMLGSAQRVSVLYFLVSLIGLAGTLSVPWLVRRLSRRRVYALGAFTAIAGAALLSMQSVPALFIGLAAHIFSIGCMEVTLNLYVMDHISRRELGRFEPQRLFFTGVSWTLGPLLGVFLKTTVGHGAPFAAAIMGTALALAYFWFLRLRDNPAVAPSRNPPPGLLGNIGRYFAQPRLLLAWLLCFCRAGWWSMFFIYAPIYGVALGLDEMASATMVSMGSATMFLVPLWGWVGRRYGLRLLLAVGYTLTGVMTMAVTAAAAGPWLGPVSLIGAAFAASIIDGAGNVPFLRAVRPHQRPEMTSVFLTYRGVAQLVSPGIFALVLTVFAVPAVFLVGGVLMLGGATLTRFIPRRL